MTKIAVITGAASGIGAALAAELTADNYHVVIADIDEQAASLTSERLNAEFPGSTEFHPVDVAEHRSVVALVEQVLAEHGHIDLMVNNAGIAIGGPIAELDIAHWDRAIDVNLRGVVNGVQAVLPAMLTRGRGHIVNVASLAGLIPSPGMAPYSATKHAVVGMSLSMQLDLADTGVDVTVVCPGFTDTPILDKFNPADLPPVPSGGSARSFAESLPGGVYDVSELAADIVRGIEKNMVMVVAPATAKAAWRSYRTSPAGFQKLTQSAAKNRRKSGE